MKKLEPTPHSMIMTHLFRKHSVTQTLCLLVAVGCSSKVNMARNTGGTGSVGGSTSSGSTIAPSGSVNPSCFSPIPCPGGYTDVTSTGCSVNAAACFVVYRPGCTDNGVTTDDFHACQKNSGGAANCSDVGCSSGYTQVSQADCQAAAVGSCYMASINGCMNGAYCKQADTGAGGAGGGTSMPTGGWHSIPAFGGSATGGYLSAETGGAAQADALLPTCPLGYVKLDSATCSSGDTNCYEVVPIGGSYYSCKKTDSGAISCPPVSQCEPSYQQISATEYQSATASYTWGRAAPYYVSAPYNCTPQQVTYCLAGAPCDCPAGYTQSYSPCTATDNCFEIGQANGTMSCTKSDSGSLPCPPISQCAPGYTQVSEGNYSLSGGSYDSCNTVPYSVSAPSCGSQSLYCMPSGTGGAGGAGGSGGTGGSGGASGTGCTAGTGCVGSTALTGGAGGVVGTSYFPTGGMAQGYIIGGSNAIGGNTFQNGGTGPIGGASATSTTDPCAILPATCETGYDMLNPHGTCGNEANCYEADSCCVAPFSCKKQTGTLSCSDPVPCASGFTQADATQCASARCGECYVIYIASCPGTYYCRNNNFTG